MAEAENDDVKAMMAAGRGRVSLEMDQKAITALKQAADRAWPHVRRAIERADGRAFDKRDRRLYRPDCVSVRVAGSTADHFRSDEGYRPRNLATMAHETDDFARCVEPAQTT